MENENLNQNVMETPQVGQTDNLQTYVQESRKKRNKILIGIFASLFVVIIAIFAYMSPGLFRASITEETGGGVPTSATKLYIPSYEGGIGETGDIAIKTKDELAELDAVTFTLTYDPIDALIFDSDPVVFDDDTVFQGAAFSMANDDGSGNLSVTVIFDTAETIENTFPVDCSTHDGVGNQAVCEADSCVWDTPNNQCNVPDGDYYINPLVAHSHPTLFKLALQIDPGVSAGQEIDLGIEDLAVLNGITSVSVGTMQAGTITVESQNELKVLNAQALDSNSILVNFSDYLADYDNTTYYDVTCNLAGVLGVSNVDLGSIHGYGQKAVVLSTTSQTAGDGCVLTVNSVTGNSQGEVNSAFDSVMFAGYGQTTGELSDFGMESADVPTGSYNQVVVTFTDDVKAASVTVSDFELKDVTGGTSVTISNVASVTGNQVTLTISNDYNFIKRDTYLLKATGEILRNSDNADLGINMVAFNGYKNGPRIISSSLTEDTGDYTLTVNFDENIEESDSFSYYGHLYETGSSIALGTVDTMFDSSISGSTLTMVDVGGVYLADSTKNYTFSVSATTNIVNTTSNKVLTDEAYKTITFWGYDHDDTGYGSGSLYATERNIVTLGEGEYDLDQVAIGDISVFYYQTINSKVNQAISSISTATGDLEIVFTNSLVPNKHYIAYIKENAADLVPIIVQEFVIDQDLEAVSAEATASAEACVDFSDNIDELTVNDAQFEVYNSSGTAIGASNVDVQGDFQSVCLDTGTLSAGQVYYVNAGEASDYIYEYQDANALKKTAVVFGGYGTAAVGSEVVISSVTSTSSTTVDLNFSADVDATTMTPVNIDIYTLSDAITPNTLTQLTVTDINQIDGNSFELETSVQGSGVNYFVVLDGVEDAGGLLLGNAAIPNFFGFQQPVATVTNINPSIITNDVETEVVLSGQNLDTIVTVNVGNTEVTISSQSASSLTFTIPVDFPSGTYDLELINSASGSQEVANALVVSSSITEMQVLSEESQAVPYEVPNDGITTTTLWVLVEDPIGLSDIDTVIVDLSDLDGSSTQQMEEDDGVQPSDKQWYKYQLTIPATVPTSETPYELPVEVNKDGDIAYGTVSILVTNDVYQSVAPVINQLYVSPLSLAPDGTTPVT
ncbi:hypothetical protein KKA95_02030, partial [Patescibacteria group bacterium]|nr:hypothetical protein [Patescibacteria group bacterium]